MAVAPPVLDEIIDALLDGADALVEQVFDRARHLPEVDGRTHVDLTDVTRRSTAANVRRALQLLRTSGDWRDVAPAEALEEAALYAAAGLDLDALERTYRQGHAAVLEVLLDAALDLEPHQAHDAARSLTRGSFAYVDAVLPAVRAAYDAERRRLARSTARRRRAAVEAVLDGEPPDERALGGSLRGPHVGVVAEGPSAETRLAALGSGVVVGVAERLAWGWLAAPPATPPPAGLRLGVGEPGRDVAGFRRTHAQATRALRVATLLALPVARYGDYALEARALDDERAASAFVAEELGPLAGEDARARRLRATLDAYLRRSCNATAAGAALGVNDRTVAYRVRSAEALLGAPVDRRATELSVALRWHALLRRPSGA